MDADELCSSLLKPNNRRTWFGIGRLDDDRDEPYQLVADHTLCPNCGTKLHYDYLHYHHIGHATCPACDFRSFDADYLAETVEEELPQKQCPNCGKMHDFDYPKCPFCKYEY